MSKPPPANGHILQTSKKEGLFVQYVIIVIVIFLLAVWLGLAATGFKSRDYTTLPEDAALRLGNETLTPEQLAARYQPHIYMDPATTSPPPVVMWYEIIDVSDHWVLVYFVEWEDEIHPNIYIHYLYSLFRAAYYGWPVKDIEFVQINVDKETGQIKRVRFETSMEDDFDIALAEHFLVYIDCHSDDCFMRITDSKGSETVVEKSISLNLAQGRHLQLGVATWNHLMVLLEANDTQYTKLIDFELRYLDDYTYRRDKYTRKSQGDYVTQESALSPIIGVVAAFVAITMLVVVARHIIRFI